jgi:hypothetical protein
VVFVLGLRLGWLLGDFTAVRVVSARGKPMVQVDGIVRPLLTGDVFKSETPIFLTDNSSSVVLSLRGVLVKLLPSSQLTVQQAEYRSKPIRRFALDKGEARFHVASVSGRSSLFDVVCGGVIARTKAGRFGIRHRPGKKDGAEVLSAAGEVQVITAQMGTQLVIPGTMVSAAPNDTTVPPPLTVSKDIIKSLQEDGDLAGIGNALSAFAAIEEKAMLAVNDGVQNVTGFQITAGMSDAAAHAQASFAMNGLLTLLTDPPPTLDYRTLRPLPLEAEAREKILKCFRGHRLLSYKVLPGGCEVIARAKDSKATVYVARNGAVTKLSEAEAAKRGYGPPTDDEE